ncbi:unnamed protein product [Microthlaspi erraticum]|uniref:Uncharacterized protein n=1 Tax=Microthlaspi erraticum TaxID=1685480 RepID=A0A6D2JY86_9BRAS|nr:unnamed protein product [Microthlaspi erraticum]
MQCQKICNWEALQDRLQCEGWVVNSVVMDHATIGDGCSIQGSVICSHAQLQERVALRDCQVEAGYVVCGDEHKGETFARK